MTTTGSLGLCSLQVEEKNYIELKCLFFTLNKKSVEFLISAIGSFKTWSLYVLNCMK